MPVQTEVIADCVARYATRLHEAAGPGHHVASPLGAWLLLALAAPAAAGPDRAAFAEVLGCDAGEAAQAAAGLLAHPHPAVASAAAVWTAPGPQFPVEFGRWRDALPPQVTTGDLPAQAELDAWAREHTSGLIDRFPVDARDAALVLATALATKVSWEVPFEVAPAAALGAGSPWAGRLSAVLRTPEHAGASAHEQFVATVETAGDVIVHAARAADGLLVVSAGALPDVPAGQVLSAAHAVGHALATGSGSISRRALASLPLGEGPLWTVREVRAAFDSCSAVLPAWSAASRIDLKDPALGFGLAGRALAPQVPDAQDWTAVQSAVARYSRTGFEAAAVTAVAVAAGMVVPSARRDVVLRFAHPYACVAIAAGGGPWHALPVFSAWVSEPSSADEQH